MRWRVRAIPKSGGGVGRVLGWGQIVEGLERWAVSQASGVVD